MPGGCRRCDVAGTAVVRGGAGARYRPGLLALREGRLLEAAVRELPAEPEVVIANAAGRDHALARGRVALASCRLSVRARAHVAAPADDRFGLQ